MRAYLCEDSREIASCSAWGSLVSAVGYLLGDGTTGMFSFPWLSEEADVNSIIRCRLCITLLGRLASALRCMDCSPDQVKHTGEGYVSRITIVI